MMKIIKKILLLIIVYVLYFDWLNFSIKLIQDQMEYFFGSIGVGGVTLFILLITKLVIFGRKKDKTKEIVHID